MIKKAIENFAEQFAYEPVVENADKLPNTTQYLLCGMGGSHLQGGIARMLDPCLNLMIHQDYGLPSCITNDHLIIVSSYSGNTQEALSSFQEATKKGLQVAVSTKGGKLLDVAKEREVPYVQVPDTGIQPRSALGYTTKALLKLLGEEELLREAGGLKDSLEPKALEQKGKEVAERIRGKIPVIYSSRRNEPIAYNWKIKFNESSKIPSFFNVFPELNHNEMAGFDVLDATRELSEKLHVIVLKDASDDPRIQKRMGVLERLYGERGVSLESIELKGKSALERIFNSLLLADWAAWHTAHVYGTEPEQVPIIEEFKKLIAE